MLEDTFGEEFKEWNTKLTGLKNDAETYVDDVVDKYSKELGWMKDVMDAAKLVGPVLDAASFMILCGKKPGWHCLSLIVPHIQQCGMQAALNICEVQKQIAGIVSIVGPLRDIPATLAQTALDLAKDASPEGLKDIFSEKVPTSGAFNNDAISGRGFRVGPVLPGLNPSPGKDGILPNEGEKKEEEKKEEDKKEGKEKSEGDQGSEGEGAPKEAPKADKEGGEPDEQPGETPGGKPGGKEGKAQSDEGGEPKGQQPSPEGGEQPGPGPSAGDKPGAPGGNKPGGSSGPPPQGGGQQPQGQQQGAGGGGQGSGPAPKPDEVHKALSDLLHEQGPEAIAALAKLAEQAGMPGDAPLTAEQVRKLQELIKKSTLTPEDLEKLAGGQQIPKGRAKPLERFLDTEAHGEAMKQTLNKLRQKQYEFKFREMARLKMHWKIMVPYKPGPFRNAPASCGTTRSAPRASSTASSASAATAARSSSRSRAPICASRERRRKSGSTCRSATTPRRSPATSVRVRHRPRRRKASVRSRKAARDRRVRVVKAAAVVRAVAARVRASRNKAKAAATRNKAPASPAAGRRSRARAERLVRARAARRRKVKARPNRNPAASSKAREANRRPAVKSTRVAIHASRLPPARIKAARKTRTSRSRNQARRPTARSKRST